MLKREIDRKAVHILSAAIPLSAYYIPIQYYLILLWSGTFIFLFFDFFRRYSLALEKIFTFFAGFAMRKEEEHKYKLTGASWELIALSIMFTFYPKDPAVVSALLLHWSDALAALVGKKWGRIKWSGDHTLEGSLAFIISGLFIFRIGFPQFSFLTAFIVVFITALAEGTLRYFDDNFVVPLLSVNLLMFLS